jgi:reductive dehalogenase
MAETEARRDRRYPWWVKAVARPTTEFDLEKTDRIAPLGLVGRPESLEKVDVGWQPLGRQLRSGSPGRSLRDSALHWAFSTYFTRSLHPVGGSKITTMNVHQLLKTYVPTPEQLGVDRWEGPEEEASAMVEHAATQFGAVQVGFAALEPKWLYANARIDSEAEELVAGPLPIGEIVVPERFRRVVVAAAPVPYALSRHTPGDLGSAGDRSGWARSEMLEVMLINFLTGLGYGAAALPGAYIPHALMAGLGEMGRMNRLISPVLGGNFRMAAILTDLPLALDRPIDFGLQEFCARCKKCAEVCPPQALSHDDEPSWEPKGPWSAPGKRVHFEKAPNCLAFNAKQSHFCCACMASCPWTKPDTLLHKVGRAVSATVPRGASLMVKLDEAFGFGLVAPSEKTRAWWDQKLPVWGIDTNQRQRPRTGD